MSDAQSVPIRLTDFDLNSNDCSVHWLLLFFWLSSVCCSSTNSNFSTFRDPKKGVRTRSFTLGRSGASIFLLPFFFCLRLLVLHTQEYGRRKKHWSKQTEEIRNAAPELLLITSKLFLQDWFWGLRELRYPGAVCFQQSSTKLFFPLGNQSPHHGVPKCLLGMFYLRSRPCHPIFVKLSVYLGAARPLSS